MYGAIRPFESRRFFVDENELTILAEMRTRRHVTQAAKVWDVNPDRTAHIARNLTNLTAATTLISLDNTLHVWRVEQSGIVRNVDPSVDHSADVSFDLDPGDYDAACTGALASSCPNQAADAVNVYYHVNGFREALTAHFTALGVSPSLNDPLDVFVNFPIDDPQGGFVANNAFYNSSSCGGSFDRCLIFLYPDTETSSACGGSPVDFYDLAREGNVAVHEYQHYMTDQITGLVASSSSAANVGDVIHEGYSDYFGASHVIATAAANAVATTGAAVVGEYGFQECTFYERDIGTIREIAHSAAEGGDPHLGGHSFASGLLDLRTTYGALIVDRIALQSLFLVPAEPGSLEAVEALVQADELLYAGAHVTEIRDVFYNQVKFLPNADESFRDGNRAIRELGMRSCAAIHTPGEFGGSGALALSWLFALLAAGRFFTRRTE
jgi:hypothetical protein